MTVDILKTMIGLKRSMMNMFLTKNLIQNLKIHKKGIGVMLITEIKIEKCKFLDNIFNNL